MSESIKTRFEILDFNPSNNYTQPYSFNSKMELKERSQVNRKYQHSRSKHPPDYHKPIKNRFEIMDFS